MVNALNSKKEYSVSEITEAIKNTMAKDFFLVHIKGEIAGFKKHEASGHYYFSLKDKENIINLVMFKSNALNCKFPPKDGMEVIATGKITTYKSNYHLQVSNLELSGEGDILKKIQEIKERLQKEGLFAKERKKTIKKYPQNVALLTAEGGAALQDILVRLKNRTPIKKLYLYNSLMQGITASQDIIRGIKYLNLINNKYNFDAIVITRGGGSMEDLMAFNDENLAREVAKSKIPIISAVGHEVDWTIIDYVSDLRLPTPTSVAEHLTMSKDEARNRIYNLFKHFLLKKYNKFKSRQNKLTNISTKFIKNLFKKVYICSKNKTRIKLLFINFVRKLANRYNKNTYRIKQLNPNLAIKLRLLRLNERIKNIEIKMLRYERKYPIVLDNYNNRVRYKKDVKKDNEYIIKFADGDVKVKVI